MRVKLGSVDTDIWFGIFPFVDGIRARILVSSHPSNPILYVFALIVISCFVDHIDLRLVT